ncbi:C40 family peptidase [Taklimakanibacter deserti]|uniref:C40 family peptidase n=1 Tax=Taklimakanibacter deserti TaxID=2267839 RepID=UPI000E654D43
MNSFDPRLHAIRPDIADARLGKAAESARLVEGEVREVAAPLLSLYGEPRFDARLDTQGLMGERVRVFDAREGWAWLQLESDGYVGYAAQDDLAVPNDAPTHRIAVPSTFMFPAPDIKSQPVVTVTLNARVCVVGGDERFAHLDNGRFVVARHLKPLSESEPDFVAVAEAHLHVPYLWGGKSVLGIDCSGLVQLALEAAGHACPRDADMQEKDLGRALPKDDLGTLERGDLVFWDGHVGVMTDARMLLHANAYFMQVTHEPLNVAVERIARRNSPITSIRRLI